MKENILITGATGKLGQNIVKNLSSRYKFLIVTRNIEKTKNIFSGMDVDVIKCDLSLPKDVINTCRYIKDKYSNLYGIINNAAVDIDNELEVTKYEEYEYLFNVNVEAPYIIIKELIQVLLKNNVSKVINISSNLRRKTVKGATEYSMSKAAIESLTRSITVEYGSDGVNCNTVSIGGMRGRLTKVGESGRTFSAKDEDYSEWKVKKDKIPMARQGLFVEFSNVIEFLLSRKSNYINGANIVVDGGINVLR